MSEEMEQRTIPELYHELVGVSRARQGELTIDGFADGDYEAYYYALLEQLAPFIGENYEHWYTTWARRQHRKKGKSRHTFDFYDPQYEKHVSEQTIREQLVTIKFFLERRSASAYGKKTLSNA